MTRLGGPVGHARVTDRIVHAMLRLFRVRRALLYEFDPASQMLTCTAVAGGRDPQAWMGQVLPIGAGVVGRAFSQGEAAWIPDALSDESPPLPEAIRQRLELDGLRSVAAVPLISAEEKLGVLSVNDALGREFGDDDIEMLGVFADQAATALESVRLHEESEQRRHASDALAAVARLLSETLDAEMISQRIADSVRRLLGASASTVYRLEPESGDLIAVAASGQAALRPDLVFRRGTGVAGVAVMTGRTIGTPNLLADPRIALAPEVRAVIERLEYRAVLAVPLRAQDRIIGALGVGDRAGRVFDEDEIAVVERFADQAALALENARLYESATQRQREAEIIAELARSVNLSLELDVVLQSVADAAKELCGSDLAQIALRESGTPPAMRFRYATWPLPREWDVIRIEPGKGLAGRVLVTGRPWRTSNYAEDPALTKDYSTLARSVRIVAAMAVPIRKQDEMEGLLVVANQTPRAFTDRDEEIVTRLAEHAAIALRNAELYERAEAARREAERAFDALRVSEEQYRALVEGSLQGIYIHQNFVTQFANRATARIFGYDDAADVIGKDCRILFAPEERPGIEALHAASPRGDPVQSQHEVQGLRRDGTPIWLHLLVSRVPWQGTPAVQVTVHDITERRSLEAQLRQAQKMEAIGRLAGGIAHDFNNLLTVIGGRSQLLLRRLPSDGGEHRDVALIRQTADRATALIKQLLAFSRRQILEPKVLDLNTIIEAMVPMLRRLIGEDIELTVGPRRELGRVYADPGQIEQVILNLAVNARDAMPGGGGLILETDKVQLDETYARTHVGARPGPYVMLAVRDTGIGMDAETQAHVFEPFFTTKEPGKGTGLGLATVYGIVKQSGGNIWVSSEPGRGTTFKIYLPRVELTPDEGSRPTLPAVAGGTETILLAEDEDEVRSLARDILDAFGYAVLMARDAEEALVVAAQHRGPIHLLLSDVVMPKMSGRQLAEMLTRTRPDIKVVYVSGYTDDAIVHHGVLEPGTHLVAKPFTPEALARKVREVLDLQTESDSSP